MLCKPIGLPQSGQSIATFSGVSAVGLFISSLPIKPKVRILAHDLSLTDSFP